MPARSVSARTRSRFDQNQPAHALASPALNVRASHERLPFATFRERQVLTMTGWDTPRQTLDTRRAAKARLEAARANYRATRVA